MAKYTTRDPMYGESKIKGSKGPKKPSGVKLPIIKAGKGGSPGQPYDDPEKGKGPFVPPPKRLAKKVNKFSGKVKEINNA